MDLDILKEKLNAKEPRYHRDEIQSIFEIKAKHAVNNVDRVMHIDLIVMSIVAASMVCITFIFGLENRHFISIQILLLSVVLYLHFALKRRVIYKQLENHGIINSIDNIVRKTLAYIKLYKIIIPIVIGSIYLKTVNDIAIAFDFEYSIKLLAFTMVIPMLYAAYKLTAWLALKLYGGAIVELELLKKQLTQALK